MPPQKSGNFVIGAILLLAVSLAGFAVWFNYQSARRSLAFWGHEQARRIAGSPRVFAVELEPAVEGTLGERVTSGEDTWSISASTEVTAAGGIINIRQALLSDATYDWQTKADEEPRWQFALKFVDRSSSIFVMFDFTSRQVAAPDSTTTLVLRLAAAEELHSFFIEQLRSAAPAASD